MKPWCFVSVGALILLSGCANYVNVPLDERPLVDELDVGDHVEVRTKDGETFEFVLTEIDASTLAGADRRFERSDLAHVAVRSYRRTGWIVLGVVGGLWLIDSAWCSDPAPTMAPSDC